MCVLYQVAATRKALEEAKARNIELERARAEAEEKARLINPF